MERVFMDGNEAVAYGAVRAGCRFFAGYPITPATSIYSIMLKILPPLNGICLQGEDEIASIGFCLGASMAGMKVMTATSGPGISLYSENISFAIGSEIPIVIVDVQRLGPSTGSATNGADGDVQFLMWGNSGGLPVVVLCPKDALDAYVLTIEAFNISERLRCPVFIASNKEVAMTKESVDLSLVRHSEIEYRKAPSGQTSYLPFSDSDGDVPGFLPIGGDTLVRQTSSTHGPDGFITINPETIRKNQMRLNRKILSRIDEISYYERFPDLDSDILVITYGVSARAVMEAVTILRRKKVSVSALVLKTLWPVPENIIHRSSRSARRIVVVEMNLGLYLREIIRILPHLSVTFIGEMNGRLITPHQIMEDICNE